MIQMNYRLAQYMKDPEKQEGKNFALIAHDGERSHLRALGLSDDGKLDLEAFDTFLGREPGGGWIIAEWVDWIRHLTEHEGKDESILNEFLEAANAQLGALFFSPAMSLELPYETSIELALNEMAGRLIPQKKRRKTPKRRFEATVTKFLQSTKLESVAGFEREIELEVIDDGVVSSIVRFPFAITKEPRFVFKTIATTGRKDYLTSQVNDARICFDAAIRSGFVKSKQKCIVLTETVPHTSLRYLAAIIDIAQIVDVTAKVSEGLLTT
jgi:hypothetical protein